MFFRIIPLLKQPVEFWHINASLENIGVLIFSKRVTILNLRKIILGANSIETLIVKDLRIPKSIVAG